MEGAEGEEDEVTKRTCPHCKKIFSKEYGRDRHVSLLSCPVLKAQEVKEKTEVKTGPDTVLKEGGVLGSYISKLNHCRYIRYLHLYLIDNHCN